MELVMEMFHIQVQRRIGGCKFKILHWRHRTQELEWQARGGFVAFGISHLTIQVRVVRRNVTPSVAAIGIPFLHRELVICHHVDAGTVSCE